MGLSSCEKCWDTPCTCGWEYRHYSIERRIELAAVVLGMEYRTLARMIEDFVPIVHPKHEDMLQ